MMLSPSISSSESPSAKSLGQAEGVGDTGRAVLICVVQALQSKVAAVAEQVARKSPALLPPVTSIMSDNAGVNQRLDRDRIPSACHKSATNAYWLTRVSGSKATAAASDQNDTLHAVCSFRAPTLWRAAPDASIATMHESTWVPTRLARHCTKRLLSNTSMSFNCSPVPTSFDRQSQLAGNSETTLPPRAVLSSLVRTTAGNVDGLAEDSSPGSATF